MHGLSLSLDLNFLVNVELIQLALGKYEIQLIFSNESRICIQSEFTFEHDGVVQDVDPSDSKSTGSLAILLGEKIVEQKIKSNKELNILFESGKLLRLRDSSRNFESFVIWNKGDFIAV